MRTAEQIFSELQRIPFVEQEKFFNLLAKRTFQHDEDCGRDELLADLGAEQFTAKEAAEYLDVSSATFRRYVRGKKIEAVREIGTSHLFSLDDLRELKMAIKKVKYNRADVGRIAKENPDLPNSFIQDVLISMEGIKNGEITDFVLPKK